MVKEVKKEKIDRIKKGILQVELSKLTKINLSRLNLIENGWVDARPDELQRIKEVIYGYGK